MSPTTDEILEKLKSITMSEAAELVKQIEDYLGVSTAPQIMQKYVPVIDKKGINIPLEKMMFDVVLVEFSPNSLIYVVKQVLILTQDSLWEIVNSLYNLPIVIKSNVNIYEAEQIKQKFEEVGATVSLK